MSEIDRLTELTRIPRADLDALGDLDDTHHAALRAAFEHARDTRDRELDEAIDNGLTMVPRLVRPAVRRMLFS
ncbi:hypothetical protein JK358_21745 [Nocardia sp. 2]|uniref:Uncharacterized protein n=1 Tax=Nocardia acididurans TaxID=2802282 RepID=A0ABS1MAF1_9NOCA|nr:hypothetical protein [Nocardia acididurans]MBL1077025.1 hypothetical protein [Nocardia acididurans]